VAVEMTARRKSGKPKSGFPTLPTALGNPQRAADSHIHHSYGGGDGSGCGSPPTASLKQQHPKVGRNKPPKWAKRSCQTQEDIKSPDTGSAFRRSPTCN